jgi:hypothetical protein
MSNKKRYEECPESVSGHDFSGRKDGKCAWCLAKVGIAERRPPLGKPQAEIESDYWYNLTYNPDDTMEW